MRSYPMGDMRDRCAGHAEGVCEGEKCASDCFIRVPDAEPKSSRRFFASPKKFKSKFHKKMHKMEVAFDKAHGRGNASELQHLIVARINKSAESLQGKIDLLEGKEKKKDGKTDKDSGVS